MIIIMYIILNVYINKTYTEYTIIKGGKTLGPLINYNSNVLKYLRILLNYNLMKSFLHRGN